MQVLHDLISCPDCPMCSVLDHVSIVCGTVHSLVCGGIN